MAKRAPGANGAALNDQAARDRIKTALNVNMLVEAGAGSGKTYMMAVRMAAGVARGDYDARRMAAVTFTRKAAAELRGRFQEALEKELASAAGDAERADRCHRALANLKTWLQGTHRRPSGKHLQVYLDEFVFRHNRRRTPMAAFQTLLGLATVHGPTTYDMLYESELTR